MKPWIITKDDEIHIALPEFGETYFGDADSMTPEEWRIVHMISATPMLLAACKALISSVVDGWPPPEWDDNHLLMIQATAEDIREALAAIAQAEETQ